MPSRRSSIVAPTAHRCYVSVIATASCGPRCRRWTVCRPRSTAWRWLARVYSSAGPRLCELPNRNWVYLLGLFTGPIYWAYLLGLFLKQCAQASRGQQHAGHDHDNEVGQVPEQGETEHALADRT